MIAKSKQPAKGKTRLEYRIARGAHIKRQQAVPLLKVIKQKFKGKRPSPEALVAEAKKKDSPIHHLFDWDVGRAAEAHWRAKAQYYLRHINVVEVEVETRKIVRGPVRFAMPDVQSVTIHNAVASYTPTQRLGKEPVRVVLERARRDFHSWIARYGSYVEFLEMYDPVIREFKKLEAKLDAVKPRPKK